MSYSFTTDPIDAGSGEGTISEAIEAAYQGDKKTGSPAKGQAEHKTTDEARVAVEAAKRVVHGMVAVLGPNVASYRIRVVGHANPGNAKKKDWADDTFSVAVDVHEYAKLEADDEE